MNKLNLERYKEDLKNIISFGNNIIFSFQFEIYPELKDEYISTLKTKKEKDKFEKNLKDSPNFFNDYQRWYSESLILLKQLLPDRVDDFVDLYKKTKS